jgi:hypothetical protein
VQDLGSSHPIVAISLQTLGHILRMRQQLDGALEVAKRCGSLRASQPQGLQMAAALHLQVGTGAAAAVHHHHVNTEP